MSGRLIWQSEGSPGQLDGVGVYDEGDGALQLIAYSQQGNGVFDFHVDEAAGLGAALQGIARAAATGAAPEPLQACPICYGIGTEMAARADGLTRCVDEAACGERLRAYIGPVRDMDHPRLSGLPEIIRDAVARVGDPTMQVNGGSLFLSDLFRMAAADAYDEAAWSR